MLLLSDKPVTQSLRKIIEPLRQMTKRLTHAVAHKICNGTLNLLLSKAGCLASFQRRLLLKIWLGGLPVVTIQARFKHFCQRLRADANKGSAAVEFAMVAPVFFLLLMGTTEVGIMFFAQSSLQNAVNDAARLVRTGQNACFTTVGGVCQPMTSDQFRTQICNEVVTLLQNCAVDPGGNTDLQFDVTA
jgi:hypothetical protein